MTRDEIEKAARKRGWTKDERFSFMVTIDFAFDMVKRHNEELAKAWIAKHGYDKYAVADWLREAAPK